MFNAPMFTCFYCAVLAYVCFSHVLLRWCTFFYSFLFLFLNFFFPFFSFLFSSFSSPLPKRWDSGTCHNPDAIRTPDGYYVIYYMGSNGSKDQATSEFAQRVGMAWSRSPYVTNAPHPLRFFG